MYINEPMDVSLAVPPVPPTGLKNCSVIDIDYFLEVIYFVVVW